MAIVVLLRGLAELALRLESHACGLGLQSWVVLLHGLDSSLLWLLWEAVGLLLKARLLRVLLAAKAGLLGLIVASELGLEGWWAKTALLGLKAGC